MQIYKGIGALSEFRRAGLLKRLQKIDASIQDLQAEYIHLADVKRRLAKQEDEKLQQLLTYDKPFVGDSSGELFLVVPRPGTISPWSSKATDIAHDCGLDAVSRIERGKAFYITATGPLDQQAIGELLHDRMTEAVLSQTDAAKVLFETHKPRPVIHIDVLKGGVTELEKANSAFGMALSADEITYLVQEYQELGRNPTDAELMMFAVVNSEHCRHKIFNASWIVDGKKQSKSLFKMIKNTYEKHPEGILSAYSDNAAVLAGSVTKRFFANAKSKAYGYTEEAVHIVTKAETHNHPTAIAPVPGAATGAGGEIRDEGATGRGAKPKIGMAGYTVSNLQLPGMPQPWEVPYGKPDRIVSALDIMIEAPIGAAAFGNEFGRPNVCGYFRTYEQNVNGEVLGYHKPLMIAGGLGNIRDQHVQKQTLPVGAKLIVLGGPSMLIGLGGGSAASMQTGTSGADLDFASVQRANAELERRVQEVIDQCWALGKDNPIISIHDVGAGGVSNALPELVHDSGLGATIELRDIPNAEPGMSPREIWCNEAQERYVLGIAARDVARFTELCEREQCLFAVVGETTKAEQLLLTDRELGEPAIDVPLSLLFGKPPKMERSFTSQVVKLPEAGTSRIDLSEAIERVLHIPSVGSKQFLITIGDRNVGGLTVRDQMVGPWQVPVSDVAVSAAGFETEKGEAMAVGERTPVAAIDSAASARLAVGEVITNMAAARIGKLSDIKLSANWMAAAGSPGQDQALYEAVKAVGEDFCPALGLTIPVGKDSLSMRTVWQETDTAKSVTSPLSVIMTGFAAVKDIRKTLTPELQTGQDSALILIDLGKGSNRLGGSALLQAYGQTGNDPPDADANLLKTFFAEIQKLNQAGQLLAYHDRSDGGLLTTVVEMAFAARCGLEINLSKGDALAQLFNEELGAVIQVPARAAPDVLNQLNASLPGAASVIGKPATGNITITQNSQILYENSRATLQSWWAETSYHIQKLRDNPDTTQQEYDNIIDTHDAGLQPHVTFDYPKGAVTYKTRPKVAIFRVQGVNGQVEMAAAFDRAGFTSIDVTLSDITSGRVSLDDFVGLVACGGFSYGDILGAGEGWAKSILFSPKLSQQFKQFFERPDTFSLGVCNGCQMLSALKSLIPGAQQWPRFLRNTSEQFEARLVQVKLTESPSIFFQGMAGSILPVPVAHGEGRAVFEDKALASLVAGQFVDSFGHVTERYPYNPNGSVRGVTALTTPDGRATILMPHPERAFLTQQLSWHPRKWDKESPWFQMFLNARNWVG
ncbi:MAG TPA: phosphoribosylformylglycinamidine synthase [Patescibacteria group bacterium]|nr:phosphoribosylformylglycinamidine synthase [Patescibacteria group bacterium]